MEGLGAALGVLLLTPVVIRAARGWGHVDEPSAARWHHRPVVLLGGVAIVGAGAVPVLLSGAHAAVPAPVWGGLALVFGIGLIDDVGSTRPTTKLLAQVVAAGCVLGAGVEGWSDGPAWVSVPLTVVWVVGVTNAFNLIDGLDGLAAGIAAIAATALGVMAGVEGNAAVAGVAMATAGAAGAFLVFNAPPARVFMGDCGSMALGYVLAVLALVVPPASASLSAVVAPALVLAVPLVDTTFVTCTRLGAGRSVMEGGTDHIHHRLALWWQSERGAVATLHGSSLAVAALALLVYGADGAVSLVAAGMVALVAGGAGWGLRRATEPRIHRDRLRRIRDRGNGIAPQEDTPVPPQASPANGAQAPAPASSEGSEPSP